MGTKTRTRNQDNAIAESIKKKQEELGSNKDGEKNQDQSKKSMHGNKFNAWHEKVLLSIIKDNFLYCGRELKFVQPPDPNYAHTCDNNDSVTMDHCHITFDRKYKKIIIALGDCTTSYRRDRISQKAQQARRMHRLREIIISQFISVFECYADYEIIIVNILVFPDEYHGLFKNAKAEETNAMDCIIDVNYEMSIHGSSKDQKQIDAAMTSSQLKEVVEYICDHDELEYSGSTYRDVWKKLHPGYQWQPKLAITDYNMRNNSDHLKYNIENNNIKTVKDNYMAGLQMIGVNIPKSTKVDKVIGEFILHYDEIVKYMQDNPNATIEVSKGKSVKNAFLRLIGKFF